MMPPIALHVGAHKTATTFLQKRLSDLQGPLLDQGVAYFGPDQLRKGGNLTFPTPAVVAAGRARKLQFDTQARIVARVDEEMPSGVTRVLVSEENILGSSRLNLRQAQLYPALPARLGCLPITWTDAVRDIFLSIRNYGTFYVSCQSTVAALGDWVPLTPKRQQALAATPRRWTDVAAELLERFPKARLHVWRYEDLHAVGPAVMRAMTGLPVDVDFTTERPMAALSAAAMMGIRRAWNAGGGKPLGPEDVQRIRQETADRPEAHDPFRPRFKNRFDKIYAQDWTVLSSNPLVTAYAP